RRPLAHGDLSGRPAAPDARRSAFLLSAADAVRKRVVRAHVVELRRRLVVPGAPRLAAVHRDDRALIAADQNDARIVGVDPEPVVVVAARRAAPSRKRAAA